MTKVIKIIDRTSNITYENGFTGELTISDQVKTESKFFEDTASQATSSNKGEVQLEIEASSISTFAVRCIADKNRDDVLYHRLMTHTWTVITEASLHEEGDTQEANRIKYNLSDIIVKECSYEGMTTEGNPKYGYMKITLSARLVNKITVKS